jgi:hypothetical protein
MLRTDYGFTETVIETIRNIESYARVQSSEMVNFNSYLLMIMDGQSSSEGLRYMSDLVDRCGNIKADYLTRIHTVEPGFQSNSGVTGILDGMGRLKPEFKLAFYN